MRSTPLFPDSWCGWHQLASGLSTTCSWGFAQSKCLSYAYETNVIGCQNQQGIIQQILKQMEVFVLPKHQFLSTCKTYRGPAKTSTLVIQRPPKKSRDQASNKRRCFDCLRHKVSNWVCFPLIHHFGVTLMAKWWGEFNNAGVTLEKSGHKKQIAGAGFAGQGNPPPSSHATCLHPGSPHPLLKKARYC